MIAVLAAVVPAGVAGAAPATADPYRVAVDTRCPALRPTVDEASLAAADEVLGPPSP